MATQQPRARRTSDSKTATSEPATRKTASRKTATSEPATRKTAARKTAASKTAAREKSDARAGTSEPARREPTPAAVAGRAAQQLLELTGRASEGVTGLARTEDGWTVQVEVLEARRIPDTTDVLALYEVDVDKEAQLVGYRRLRRYVRGKPNEG